MARTRNVVAWWWTVAAGVPLALVGTSLALQAAWWDELPRVMPKHWNGAGNADALGTRWSTTISTLIIGIAVPALMIAITAPSFTRGARGWVYRFLASMSAGMAALGAVLAAGTFWLHRGVAEGGPWPRMGGVTAAAFASAFVVGIAAFLIQPQQKSTNRSAMPLPSIDVDPGETVAWINEARVPRWLLWLLGGVTATVAAVAVFFLVQGYLAAGLIYLGVLVFMCLVIPAVAVFRVRVDKRGFSVVSALGWPKVDVPLENIADARAVTVDGLTEFGGYGVRMAPGAFGVVLRNGEAIEVSRRHGRRVVVTVDDAATAAALIKAFKAGE